MMLFLIEDPLHPLLKEPVAPWDWENVPEDPHELIGEMKEIMFKQNGVGLSANQVGIPYAMFIMRWQEEDEIEAFFNPRIVNLTGDNIVLEEGCLSYPGMFPKIKRPDICRVSAEFISGEKVTTNTYNFKGFTSRIVQHEMDHLDGKLWYRRASSFHLQQARNAKKKLDRLKRKARKEAA